MVMTLKCSTSYWMELCLLTQKRCHISMNKIAWSPCGYYSISSGDLILTCFFGQRTTVLFTFIENLFKVEISFFLLKEMIQRLFPGK